MERLMVLRLLVVMVLLTLTSCRTASITDIVHIDTNEVVIGEDYILGKNDELNQYEVNGVLFRPYMVHSDYAAYAFKLAVYSVNETPNVTINNYTIEGIEDIEFEEISDVIDEKASFTEYIKQDEVMRSIINITSNISKKDMVLNDSSKLLVTINVSVEKDGKLITKDLEYIFETNTRTYPVMR